MMWPRGDTVNGADALQQTNHIHLYNSFIPVSIKLIIPECPRNAQHWLISRAKVIKNLEVLVLALPAWSNNGVSLLATTMSVRSPTGP